MSADSSDSRVGMLLDGRYRLVRRIGVGGRGVVYEARQEEMGRGVAVKLLAEGFAERRDALMRFKREGRAAGRLNHPNVVVVHDFRINEDAEAYLVMELCDGGSLADELLKDDKASFARTAEVLIAVSAAVHAAHRAGIIHRDLKPANILISGGVVKVADFGLATLAEDDPAVGLTGEHAVGSPHYMSPEQAQGVPADARSDVYGLGVIAYEMLTGFVPFSGSSVTAILMKHLTEAPRSPTTLDPLIPVEASRAVLHALEKEPSERFQSATEFAEALGAALGTGARARPGSDARASTKPVPPVTTMEMERATETSPIGREESLHAMNARLLEALRGHGGFLLVSASPGRESRRSWTRSSSASSRRGRSS